MTTACVCAGKQSLAQKQSRTYFSWGTEGSVKWNSATNFSLLATGLGNCLLCLPESNTNVRQKSITRVRTVIFSILPMNAMAPASKFPAAPLLDFSHVPSLSLSSSFLFLVSLHHIPSSFSSVTFDIPSFLFLCLPCVALTAFHSSWLWDMLRWWLEGLERNKLQWLSGKFEDNGHLTLQT